MIRRAAPWHARTGRAYPVATVTAPWLRTRYADTTYTWKTGRAFPVSVLATTFPERTTWPVPVFGGYDIVPALRTRVRW